MKKIILCITLTFYSNSYSQIGIGTEIPNATIDILSSNSSDQSKSITINSTSQPSNSSNKDFLTLYNNGNLNIGGAFKPNDNPGIPESYLISNGPNNPPTWQILQKKIIFNAFQVIFTRYQGVMLQSGEIEDVKFIGSNITNIDESIGVWESDNTRYRIKKEGTYLIAWSTKTGLGIVPTGYSVRKGYSLLYYGADKTNYYISNDSEMGCSSTDCNEFYDGDKTMIHLTNSSIYLKLKVGDYISLGILGYDYDNQPIHFLSGSLQIRQVEL